jgi:hypothetical protein
MAKKQEEDMDALIAVNFKYKLIFILNLFLFIANRKREEMSKPDWQLIIGLKKLFQII